MSDDGDVELVAAPELRLALAVALPSPVAERSLASISVESMLRWITMRSLNIFPANLARRSSAIFEKELEDGKAARRLSSVAAPSVPCRNLPQFKRLRDAHEQLLLLVEFPDLVFDEVEERWLYRQPMVGKSFAHAIFGLVFHACIISYILQKNNDICKIIAISPTPENVKTPLAECLPKMI